MERSSSLKASTGKQNGLTTKDAKSTKEPGGKAHDLAIVDVASTQGNA